MEASVFGNVWMEFARIIASIPGPYALILGIFTVAAFTYSTLQLSKDKTSIREIKTLPKQDRIKYIRQKYKTELTTDKSPEIWLRNRRNLYLLIAWGMFLVTTVSLAAFVTKWVYSSDIRLVSVSLDKTDSDYVETTDPKGRKAIVPKHKELWTCDPSYDMGVYKRKYFFPTLLFNLDNEGGREARLNRFEVEVLAAKLDVTPVLRFIAKVVHGELVIRAVNFGWGSAKECTVELHEPSISKYFPIASRKVQTLIPAIKKADEGIQYHFANKNAREILRLSIGDIPSGALQSLPDTVGNLLASANKEYRESRPGWLKCKAIESDPHAAPESKKECERELNGFRRITFISPRGSDLPKQKMPEIRAIKLGQINAVWRCKTEDGKSEGETTDVKPPKWSNSLVLSQGGFIDFSYNMKGAFRPTADKWTYVIMIDPLKYTTPVTYNNVLRVIPPSGEKKGDVFHVLIGSNRSCKLVLRFGLYFSQGQVRTSDEMVFNIWSPHATPYVAYYKDADTLRRDWQTLVKKEEAGVLSNAERLTLDCLRRSSLIAYETAPRHKE